MEKLKPSEVAYLMVQTQSAIDRHFNAHRKDSDFIASVTDIISDDDVQNVKRGIVLKIKIVFEKP